MKALFTLILLATVIGASAQAVSRPGGATADPQQTPATPQRLALPDTVGQKVFRKNIIKVNLSSLVLFNNYSFSYERSLTRKITFVAGCSFMPENSVASIYLVEKFTPSVESAAETFVGEEVDVSSYLNLANVGNNTYTGEIRFYAGRKPGPRGFYLSLYGRYMNMEAAYSHDYDTNSKTYILPLDGTLKGFGGGVMIGSQWLIAKRVAFDWYILGGHYGKLKADLRATADLSTMTETEKRGLEADIEAANDKLNGKVDVEATVTDQGLSVKGSSPFAGIRGLGFSLGIAF